MYEYEPQSYLCTKGKRTIKYSINPDDMHDLTDIIEDSGKIITASDIDIKKYKNLIFNPIRFQNSRKDEELNETTNDVPKCNYLIPGEFSRKFRNDDNETLSISNANVRSINKN